MKLRDKLDFDVMKAVFNATFEDFETLPGAQVIEVNGRKHIFFDRGGSVLSIAHLDYVNPLTHFYPLTIGKRDIVLSTRADDRLGAYIVLELLPQLKVYCDVLLTFDEEKGRSTAKNFTPHKKYNWMFQFDRHGDGCVNYMYDSEKWEKTLKTGFGKVDRGSASDISQLEHLDCSGVNIGVGYWDEHEDMCYFDVDTTTQQVGLFMKFYHSQRNVHHPHSPKPVLVYKPYSKPIHYPGRGAVDIYDKTAITCDFCMLKTPAYDIFHTIDMENVCRDCAKAFSYEKCDGCHNYCDNWLTVINQDGTSSNLCELCEEDTPCQPMDMEEYVGMVKPTHCKICDNILVLYKSQYFMGICEECEDEVTECQCGRWYGEEQGHLCPLEQDHGTLILTAEEQDAITVEASCE